VPAGEHAGPYDFKRVPVAVDGSEGSEKALDCAISICKAVDASLTALAVEGKLPAYAASLGEVDEVKAEKDQFFNRVLERAKATAAASGVAIETSLIPGHAAEVISDYTRAHGHDLIVIGHRGHFLGDHLLGSTADRSRTTRTAR
jgi:nucleotide-binding universal stress UspA family protein